MNLESTPHESADSAIDSPPTDSPFHNRDFLKLWIGESISTFGSKISIPAISFLAVISLKATPAQMGALTVWRTLPAMLFSPFAGVWVDRTRRRPLMISADVANILLLGSIPAAAALGKLRIDQVYIVIFLTAIADILFGVSYGAYLPTLVGRESISRANSILNATEAVAETGAFGLAGWLVQWLTAPIAILMDAISFVFSVIFLRLISTPETPPARRADSKVAHEVRDGIRAVMRDSRLLALTLGTGVHGIAQGVFTTVYVLYFINDLGFHPGPLGLIFAVGGAASFVGAAFSVRAADKLGVQRAIVLGLAGMSVGNGLATFAHGSGPVSIALLVGQQLIGDVAGNIYFVNHLSLIQNISPPAMLGRVLASVHFVHRGATLFGAGAAAFLGAWIGLRISIGFGAILIAGAAMIIAAFNFDKEGAHSANSPA